MSNESNATTPAEDLAYIRHIMEETRRAVAMRGDAFILWGIITLIGLLGNYFFSLYRVPGWCWPALWGVLVVTGWTFMFLLIRRERSARVSMPAGRMLGAIWGSFTIALFVIFFAGIPLGAVSPLSVGGIIASVIGIAIFVTGVLIGTPWVRNLAIGWWLGAIAQFYWHDATQLLIMAILELLFFVIPGFILNAQVRRESARQ